MLPKSTADVRRHRSVEAVIGEPSGDGATGSERPRSTPPSRHSFPVGPLPQPAAKQAGHRLLRHAVASG